MTPATYALILIATHAFLPTVNSAGRVETTRKSRHSLPAWTILGAVILVVFLFIAVGRLTVLLAGVIIAGTVAYRLPQMHDKRVNLRAEDAIAQLLGTMTADLRAGATFPAALKRGADELAVSATVSMDIKAAIATAAVIAHRGGSISTVLSTSHQQLTN